MLIIKGKIITILLVGAAELFWPQWMFPKSKRNHNF